MGHAGARLLSDLADASGLTEGLSVAMAPTRHRRRGHDGGQVLADLAVMIADGGDALSDLAGGSASSGPGGSSSGRSFAADAKLVADGHHARRADVDLEQILRR